MDYLRDAPDWRLKVTPEISRRVQEELFKVGVFWADGAEVVSFIDEPVLVRTGWELLYSASGRNPTHILEEEEMQNKEINIDVPEGYEVDTENSTFTCIKFKKKEEKISKWEDLKEIAGWFITPGAKTQYADFLYTVKENTNLFATKEQAEAAIALAMLSQLVKRENEGKDGGTELYTIGLNKYNDFVPYKNYSGREIMLSFYSKESAERFIYLHHKLLTKALPLFFMNL